MRNSRIVNTVTAAAVSVTLLAGLAGGAVTASAADPVAQVKVRQEHMKALGGGMKAVGDFVKNQGSADAAKTGAANIAKVAAVDVGEIFPQGTAIGVAESYSRPALWDNWGKTQELWSAMKTNADTLVAATETGDRAQVAQAMQAVGKTCGSCHEDFRQKKQ